MAKRAGEASSSGERWVPEVLPKHTIFLSHSGYDKPFVERLCQELERSHHSPFFDQNSDSLPKGERFPPHIFKAAEQCLLAVIVLSEKYLTSKWPMLELATFMKAREMKNPNMKLLPLFYKLRPGDLVPEKWMESWKKLARDGKIHAQEIDSWSKGVEVLMKAEDVETERRKSLTLHVEPDKILPDDDFPKLLHEVVKDLRSFNGLKSNKSEGSYIEAVVDEIYKIIPPIMKYNIDGIQGYWRLCKKASSLFKEGGLMKDICKPGCLYLGLYGMGGVGKTTLCVAMCSFYQVEFRSQVCHVELQSNTKYERIERLKHVIRELGGCDDRVVEKIATEFQGLQCLQDRLKNRPPAFLAVDNVGDSQSSREEARRFISCGLACGSKVMVTSRSRSILESVLGEAKYCEPIPRLEEQEAKELFLSVSIPQKMSSPLQPGEDVIVKKCVRECKYLDDGYNTQQYHPLVLRAYGTFFHDVNKGDIMQWEKSLGFKKKLQQSREAREVNDILGLNYGNLSDAQKKLFLDAVFLFNYEASSVLSKRPIPRYGDDDYEWVISLMATMHGISTYEVKLKVEELQRLSLINESSTSLRTHALYIEFARSIVSTEGSKEKEWWVGHKDANGYNPTLKRLLLFEDASTICHSLDIVGMSKSKELWECRNLECLIMRNCKVMLQSNLDLKCFTNLRLLIILNPGKSNGESKTEILCTSGNSVHCNLCFWWRKNQNKGCLPELRMVLLSGFDLRRIPFLRDCWNLTFLSIDNCDLNKSDFPADGTSLFENLKALQTLLLSFRSREVSSSLFESVFDGILQSARGMKHLEYLEIDLDGSVAAGDCFCELDLSPLGSLTSLQTLSLPRLPTCIEELIGLDQLSQLRKLNLWKSGGLQKLRNLDRLPSSQRICVDACWHLKHPEDQFKRFQELHPGLQDGHQCLKPGWVEPHEHNLGGLGQVIHE